MGWALSRRQALLFLRVSSLFPPAFLPVPACLPTSSDSPLPGRLALQLSNGVRGEALPPAASTSSSSPGAEGAGGLRGGSGSGRGPKAGAKPQPDAYEFSIRTPVTPARWNDYDEVRLAAATTPHHSRDG